MKYWKLWSLGIFGLLIVACSKDNGNENLPLPNNNFDRGEMLVNWADNIIVPAYTFFKTEMENLNTAATVFANEPTETNLQDLRASWAASYIAFQKVSMFEIGKAEEVRYRNRLNIYPSDTQKIDNFIATGGYDLALPSTIDAQGFPAIDYLINGLAGTDSEIVSFYSTNSNAQAYKTYLNTLTGTILQLTTTVLDDWNTSFRDVFVANASSSATGSVDKLTNDYIFYFEKSLRAGKVGIPAGVFSQQPLPQNVEARYKKDLSKQLLLTAIKASQDFFNGKYFNNNTTGESFNTYLDFLNSIKNGEDLSSLINAQFNAAEAQTNELNNNFALQIETDNTKMLSTYDELQRNVILLKVDMLQALSINVDYVDADGD